MTKQIEKLIEVLAKSDVKLDATQLAEAIWLAEHIKFVGNNKEVLKVSFFDMLKLWINKLLNNYFFSMSTTNKIVSISGNVPNLYQRKISKPNSTLLINKPITIS